jgi:hypothetical protein
LIVRVIGEETYDHILSYFIIIGFLEFDGEGSMIVGVLFDWLDAFLEQGQEGVVRDGTLPFTFWYTLQNYFTVPTVATGSKFSSNFYFIG